MGYQPLYHILDRYQPCLALQSAQVDALGQSINAVQTAYEYRH